MSAAPERVVVHVDGGARGNPGPAGIGVVVTDAHGEELARANDFIGEATNNEAEYHALLLGLQLASQLGAREVEVVNDSQLVARQISGEYRVKKADLKPLHAQALARLRGFERWQVRSVPREQNELADELVNEAIDARAGTA
ncbi:MAG TPA: ribonuclease HI family protein [Solirubrobacterales bacterium]|nr:ribonuclease HI family protein [Solirubrobacterales bacterium]